LIKPFLSLREDFHAEIIYGGLGICSQFGYSVLADQIHFALWERVEFLHAGGVSFFDVASAPPNWVNRDENRAHLSWQAVIGTFSA